MKISDDVEISLTRGNTFRFVDGDSTVVYRQAPWSGRETVQINGKLVSEARHYGTSSRHEFTDGSAAYSIVYDTKSVSSGPLECSLIRDGNLTTMYRISRGKPRRSRTERFGLPVAVGAAIGITVSYGIIPRWVAPMAVLFVLLYSLFRNVARPSCQVIRGTV